MNRIISLSPSNTSLSGKYSGADTVLVKCDATDGAFAVVLPDAANAVNAVFIVKKVDSSSNAIAISGINGQAIDGAASESVTVKNGCVELMSDGSAWVEISANRTIYAHAMAGGNFGEKLVAAIACASDGWTIDATQLIGAQTIGETVTIDKAVTILFGACSITYSQAGSRDYHVFKIESDGVTLVGRGRSPDPAAIGSASNTVVTMTGANSGYHFFAKGHNSIKISGFDLVGIQSTLGTQEDHGVGITEINGAGGIFFERPDVTATGAGNNCNQIVLEDLLIKDTRFAGVYIDTPILNFLRNVRVSGAGGHGFLFNGGTSVNVQNCYCSSANHSGFHFYGTTYMSISACVAEYAGAGFTFRSAFALGCYSCGTEAMINRGTANMRTMNILNYQGGGATERVNDLGDSETFHRGIGYLVVGGEEIIIDAPASEDPAADTTYGAHVCFVGTARACRLTNPRCLADEPATRRHDIRILTFSGDSPRDIVIWWNPVLDGTVTPTVAGVYVTTVTTDKAPILNQGTNTQVYYGATGYLPAQFNDLVQCQSLRINQAPASETVTCDKVVTINLNGTNYKFPCVAA